MNPLVRQLDSLTSHPRRLELFSELPQNWLKQLADNMQNCGMWNPIETLPDGTIISGHERVRAARLLGWHDIQIEIRCDINHRIADAGLEEMIFARAQNHDLTIIEKLKCYRLLKEVFRHREGVRAPGEELRDRAAAALRFGMRGRQLDQDVGLLKLPPAVQDAVSDNRISKSMAHLIGRIPPEKRAELAREMESGAVSAEYIQRTYIRPHFPPRNRQGAVANAWSPLKKLAALQRRRGANDKEHRKLQVLVTALELISRLQAKNWPTSCDSLNSDSESDSLS